MLTCAPTKPYRVGFRSERLGCPTHRSNPWLACPELLIVGSGGNLEVFGV